MSGGAPQPAEDAAPGPSDAIADAIAAHTAAGIADHLPAGIPAEIAADTPAAATAHTEAVAPAAHARGQTQADTPNAAPREREAPPPHAPAPRRPVAHASAHGAACENCAAALTGPFCAQCGQKHGHAAHSVWHFLREATENLTDTDSRLWRTLAALLGRPGALTREFIDGHRVRYLPPLRLYLVISLVFFLSPHVTPVNVQRNSDTQHRSVRLTGPESGAPMTREGANEACQMMVTGPSELLSRFGASRLEPRLVDACHKALSDGAVSYQEVFLRNAERAMFVFLPLLALFAWLLYRRPRHYYVEHLLFYVHNQSFVFLALALRGLAAWAAPATPVWLGGTLDFAVFVYLTVYLYLAMRRMYGQGRMLTLVKYGAQLFFYFLTFALGALLTAAYTALTL